MKRILLATLIIICTGPSYSQSQTPLFIGLQPNITIEPFYEKGEFDIDIVPLVFEASLNRRVNIRVAPNVNYRFGGPALGVSDLGANIVVPVFMKAKEARTDRPFGLYLGPVLGFGRNVLNDHFTTTLGAEPGYLFETKKRFTIAMGLQVGA